MTSRETLLRQIKTTNFHIHTRILIQSISNVAFVLPLDVRPPSIAFPPATLSTKKKLVGKITKLAKLVTEQIDNALSSTSVLSNDGNGDPDPDSDPDNKIYAKRRRLWEIGIEAVSSELWLQSGGGGSSSNNKGKGKRAGQAGDRFAADKTKGQKSSTVVGLSVFKQVEGVLDNENLTGKRRKIERELGGRVIGSGEFLVKNEGEGEGEDGAEEEEEDISDFAADYNEALALNTFDDTKLYQHMIRDFVASKKTGENDDINNNSVNDNDNDGNISNSFSKRGGVEANNNSKNSKSSKKFKTNTDRRATKGRKVKYTVHEKLVGFMFPKERRDHAIGEEEWFGSLFA